MTDPAKPVASDREPLRPWLGLKSYRTEDRQRFFGRADEVQELRWRVRGAPLTVLYGESGRGKSSLLAAGLLPVLEADGYSPVILRLAYDATAPRLIDQLFAALDGALALPDVPAPAGRPSLWEYAHAAGRIAERIGARRPVLIIDQFEEAFTLGRSAQGGRQRAAEVAQLFEQLADLVENRIPAHLRAALVDDPEALHAFDTAVIPIAFVLTLREDYLGELEVHSLAMPSLMRNRVRLNELSGPSAMEAVIGPGALHVGGAEDRPLVAESVARRIVCFVAKRADDTPIEAIEAVPPLLSLVCFELNEVRIQARLDEITGELVTQQAKDILHSYYERCFAGIPPAVRVLVEDKLLTQEGGHRATYARDDAVADLRRAGVADPQREIERLIDGRLLNGEERRGFAQLELTHDVLAPIAMASRAQREVHERAERLGRASRRSGIAAAALLLVCVAVGSGALYILNLRHAVARTTALRQIESANALIQLPSAQTQALALLSQAMQSGLVEIGDADGPALRSVLGLVPTFAATAQGSVRHYAPGSGALVDVALPPPARPISVARWSPSGRHYVLADEAGQLGVWTTGSDVPVASATLAPATLSAGCAIRDAVFVDGETAVIAGTADGKVWRVAIGPGRQKASQLHDFLAGANKSELHAATDAPASGGEAASAAEPGLSRSADYDGPLPAGVGQGRQAPAATAAKATACRQNGVLLAVSPRDDGFAAGFSPDAKKSAAVRIWPKLGPPLDLRLSGSPVSLEFDKDGTRLLTASTDGTVMTSPWPPQSDSPPRRLYKKKSGDSLDAARLSPDGRWLAIADNENISIRDTRNGRLAATLGSDRFSPPQLMFEPDGRWLIAHEPARTHLFGSPTYSVPLLRRLRIDSDGAGEVRLSPDGLYRLSFAGDQMQIGTPQEPLPERSLANGADVTNAAFAPDGRFVLTGSTDGHGRIWQVAAPEGPEAAYFHNANVVALSCSRDGERFAAVYGDGRAQGLATPWALPASPRVWHSAATRIAISPDGKRFATATDDGMVRIWSAADGSSQFGQVPASASARETSVGSLQFSPDGNRLLLATMHGTSAWDLPSGTWTLLAPDAATHAGYSPDGSLIAVRKSSGAVQLLRADTASLQKAIGDEGADGDVLVFSRDGSLLLLSGRGRTLLYRLPEAAPIGSFATVGAVAAGAISPSGEWVAIADERNVALYRAPFFAGSARLVKAQSVKTVHFVSESDSPVLVTTDDTVATLRSATATPPLAELARRDLVDITQAAMPPAGGRLVLGDSGGRISVLPIDRLQPADLQPLAEVLSALGKNDSPPSLAAAIGAVKTPGLRDSLRYRLDSQLDHHPLLRDAGAPKPIDELYARLPLTPPPLQHWWKQTHSNLLLARWALASAQEHDAGRRLWRRQIRQQLAGSDDPRIRADLGLAAVLDEAGGSVLVDGRWRAIEGTIVAEFENPLFALPELTPAAARPPNDRVPRKTPPRGLVAPLHRKFLPESATAEINQAFDLLSTHLPSDEEYARLRGVLDEAQQRGDLLARYLLARLLAMPSTAGPDYAAAADLMRSAADAGVAAAQNSVGWTYLGGRKQQEPDIAVAQHYLSLAAAQGHPYAWRNLGVLEQHTNRDAARAVDRYRRAIELGDANGAHFSLAGLLEAGDGTPHDARGALEHYRLAAEQNDVRAMFALGLRLELGFVDAPDPAEARRWYREALSYGAADAHTDAHAAFRLGTLAEKAGEFTEAATSYRLAALRGHVGAHYALARLLLTHTRLASNYKALSSALIRRLLAASVDSDQSGDRVELDWLAGEAYTLVNPTAAKALPKTLAADKKCVFAEDGQCDAPMLCSFESDIVDCEGNASPRACLFENDGQCDVPAICLNGTDIADCAGSRRN